MENIRHFFDELSKLLYQKENYFKNEDGYNVSNIDYAAEQKCEQRMLKKLYFMDQATRGVYAWQVVREVSIQYDSIMIPYEERAEKCFKRKTDARYYIIKGEEGKEGDEVSEQRKYYTEIDGIEVEISCFLSDLHWFTQRLGLIFSDFGINLSVINKEFDSVYRDEIDYTPIEGTEIDFDFIGKKKNDFTLARKKNFIMALLEAAGVRAGDVGGNTTLLSVMRAAFMVTGKGTYDEDVRNKGIADLFKPSKDTRSEETRKLDNLFVARYFDEIAEFSCIRPEERGCFGDIRFIAGIIDDLVFRIVVEISTGNQRNMLIPYSLVIIPDHAGIRPCLVGGMGCFRNPMLEAGLHQGVLIG